MFGSFLERFLDNGITSPQSYIKLTPKINNVMWLHKHNNNEVNVTNQDYGVRVY